MSNLCVFALANFAAGIWLKLSHNVDTLVTYLIRTSAVHALYKLMIAGRPSSSASKFEALTKGACNASVDAGMMHFPSPPKGHFPAPPRPTTFGAGGAVTPPVPPVPACLQTNPLDAEQVPVTHYTSASFFHQFLMLLKFTIMRTFSVFRPKFLRITS